MTLRANNTARFQLEIDGAGELGVLRLTGHEGLSQLYSFTVEVVAPAALSGLFRRAALLRILGSHRGDDRLVHGIVHTLGDLGRTRNGRLHRIEIVPTVALLRHRQDCRIFQGKTVEQICREVVASAGLPADALRFALLQEHPAREYCVQYRETDWAFMRRILAEEGCFYFFEHGEGTHTMVVGDHPLVYLKLPGGSTLRIGDGAGMVTDRPQLTELQFEESLGPGKFTARDYNYLDPSDTLDAAVGSAPKDLEVYDFPGNYSASGHGRIVAQTRLNALRAPLLRGVGRGGCPRLVPGYTFTPQYNAAEGQSSDRNLMLVEVTHRGEEPQALGQDGAGQASSYGNDFVCMPADLAYCSPLLPKPSIPGPQTAIVTGPDGEEIFTDEHGRIKVQFHWDRQAKYDDTSSCWVRVSQSWAGPGWGSLWIPRVGHEVVVAFLDGDPDRPLVIGSVYHATHTPPYPLPDQRTRSGVRSESSPGGGGHNEISFEDRKGSEDVYIHAQKDLTVAVEHDTHQSIGNDETRAVKRDRATEIGHDKSTVVGRNHNEQIGADMSQSIGANATQTVGANQTIAVALCKTEAIGVASSETVGAAKSLVIGAIYEVAVGAGMNEVIGRSKTLSIGQDSVETIGKDHRMKVGAEVEIVAGKSLALQAAKDMTMAAGADWKVTGGKKGRIQVADELVIQVGEALVTLKKNGQIYIAGSKLTLKASGDVIVKGGKVKLN